MAKKDKRFECEMEAFPTRGALIGLDIGEKTIGVAVSDPDRAIAAPVTVIKRTKFTADAQALAGLVEERAVVGLILGLPLHMTGEEGPSAQRARAFARNLPRILDLPIAFWDERLSTTAMERELIALGTSRKKRADRIDAAAATFILQGALDRIKTIKETGRP